MLKIFTDVTSRRHFNVDGNLFSNDMPQMFFGGTETVYWQLCQNVFDLDTETQTPETDWPKYTGFSDISGIGAFLTADNNYTHKLKGTIAVAIEPGALLTVTATITGASRSLIDTEGVISLIDNTGEIEEVEYTSRTINGSTVVFTISDGTTVTGTYEQSSEMDVNEAVYMQASMDVGQSDPANGLFVFTIRAMSEKLRNEIIYSDVQSVTIRGLELAVFKVDPGDLTIEDVGRYVLGTFSIMSGIADTRLNPVVSTARENAVLAYIQTVVASGTEHEYSIDGATDWHETRADGDRYLRYRNVLAGGDWSPAVKLPDPVTPYDYWISLGNTGSISDYFDSIRGPQGAPGINGTNGTNGINGENGLDGEDGVSTYTKVAWASDDSGSDFSLTPSDELRYRAEIHVTEDIATPTLSDFTANGAVWVLALATGTIPDASTSVKGLVQFANSTQMVAGTATDLVLSPADLETKLAGYVGTGLLAQASGVATLDGSGKLLSEQLPEISAGPDISTAIPLALSSSGLAGTGTDAAAADHVHPNTGLVLATEKGTANGVATLDETGKIPIAQIPDGTGTSGVASIKNAIINAPFPIDYKTSYHLEVQVSSSATFTSPTTIIDTYNNAADRPKAKTGYGSYADFPEHGITRYTRMPSVLLDMSSVTDASYVRHRWVKCAAGMSLSVSGGTYPGTYNNTSGDGDNAIFTTSPDFCSIRKVGGYWYLIFHEDMGGGEIVDTYCYRASSLDGTWVSSWEWSLAYGGGLGGTAPTVTISISYANKVRDLAWNIWYFPCASVFYNYYAESLGDLVVYITGATGGQWSVNSTDWHDNGDYLSLPAGTYTVAFSTQSGYTTPEAQDAVVINDGTVIINTAYASS